MWVPPTGRPSRSQKNAFNPIVRKEDVIEVVTSQHGLPRIERLSLPRGAFPWRTWRPPRLHAKEIVAKKKGFWKGAHKIIKTKRAPSAADSYVHRIFGDALDPCMHFGVGQNAGGAWIKPMGEAWIKFLCFSRYYPNSVDLDKYDHVALFLDAARISRDRRALVLVSKEEVPYFRNMA